MSSPQSPFAWPGGKRALKKTLLGLIPEHRIYVEVFAGSAKLLFAKEPSTREVMNDLNGEVINFFRVAKHRPAALAEMFDHEVIHGGRFRELLAEGSGDELQRALRFSYLAWYSFAAMGRSFASSNANGMAGNKPMRSLDRVRELLDRTAERLRNVLIEQRDFADILRRYDSPETYFYLDPPYVHFQPNGRYDALSEERREELFAALAACKGKFLMSFDDCAEIRELCRRHRFKVRSVQVGYTLGSTQQSRTKKVGEVLISR